jgi:hypothetical protein
MQVPPHGTRTVSEADFARMKLLDRPAAASHSDADLTLLAAAMISPADPAKDGADDEENPFIPAGYTYLGQFVDHDLTFDTHSIFDDPKSLERASNMRTPRFDLDNVYGRGPDDQPYLFQDTFDGTMLLGDALENGVKDVQRNAEGRAIIGDPRNDENAVVVQLQSAFIRFHNRMVARAVAAGLSGARRFCGPRPRRASITSASCSTTSCRGSWTPRPAPWPRSSRRSRPDTRRRCGSTTWIARPTCRSSSRSPPIASAIR